MNDINLLGGTAVDGGYPGEQYWLGCSIVGYGVFASRGGGLVHSEDMLIGSFEFYT